MKIFTSYFNKAKNIDSNKLFYVAITRGAVPTWFPHKVVYMKELAPTWNLVNMWKSGSCTWEQYCQWYDIDTDLEKNRQKIINDLEWLSKENGGKTPVLLCHCKDYRHCHRSIVGSVIGAKELTDDDLNSLYLCCN